MFETLFKSEALLGVLIGTTFSFLGLVINASIEAWKESRRERAARISELRNQLGLNKRIQGNDVLLYINSQLPFWSRFLRSIGIIVHHPDLSHADLTRVSLSNQNLRGVNFSFANLTGADLHSAKVARANFTGAILINTDLSDARRVWDAIWQDCIIYNTFIRVSLPDGAITDIQELESRFGKKIASRDEFEDLLNSIGVDTSAVSIADMYLAFTRDRPY